LPSDPLILAFDTSAAHCAAALLSGPRVLAIRDEALATGQAERLIPMLQDLLDVAGADWGDLAALGVGVGPGNFTGIRISVAAARGLSLALGRPAIGVSGFAALAEGAPRPVLLAIDARRGQSYLQRSGGLGPEAAFQATPETLPQTLRDSGLAAIGHRAEEFASVTGGSALVARYPQAVAIGLQAMVRHGTPEPRPAPLYLRGADAAPASDSPPALLP